MPRISPFRPLVRTALATPIRTLTPQPTLAASNLGSSSALGAAGTSTSRLTTPRPSLSAPPRFAPGSGVLALVAAQRTLAPAVSLGGGQVRTVTYGSEYQPSQRIRKRRHGFLARNKTRNGRKTLMRRRFRGKAKLSH